MGAFWCECSRFLNLDEKFDILQEFGPEANIFVFIQEYKYAYIFSKLAYAIYHFWGYFGVNVFKPG